MAGTGGLRLGHPSCDPAPGRPGKAGREGNRILSSICPAGRGVIILYLPLSAPPRCFAVPAWILGSSPRMTKLRWMHEVATVAVVPPLPPSASPLNYA